MCRLTFVMNFIYNMMSILVECTNNRGNHEFIVYDDDCAMDEVCYFPYPNATKGWCKKGNIIIVLPIIVHLVRGILFISI